MLVENSVLYNDLKKICLAHAKDKAAITDYVEQLEKKYNLPPMISNDIITCRKDADQFSDQVLYWVVSVVMPNKVKKYFTAKEISDYSKEKYVVEQLEFPLEIPMIQVTDSQWIGVISYEELMKLRNAQVVYYNPKAQRPLLYVKEGVNSYYRIDINKDAVSAITELMQSDHYIPDTLTFNMPEDADFEYKNGKLIIRSISHFDILDGYHRYVAINKLLNENPTASGVMELRITSFPLEIERQFIWQADQKTQMTKINSETFNQYNAGNLIMDALKKKPAFARLLEDKIIDEGTLLEFISIAYIKKDKQLTRAEIIEIRDKICNGFNDFFDEHPEIADKRILPKHLCALFILITQDYDDVYEKYQWLVSKLTNRHDQNIRRYYGTIINILGKEEE